MNVQVAVREAGRQGTAVAIADCDIHPYPKSPKELYPFLERRWRRHLETYGLRTARDYGHVLYCDIFEAEHERRFLYRWAANVSEFERLNHEDFNIDT